MSKPWIKRPVVLLGLAFNAAYLVYYVFGGAPGTRLAARTLKAPDAPAPNVISRGSSDAGPTNVYPAEDLVLIRGEGRTLLFSPHYSAQGGAPRGSQMVSLRFYSFSHTARYSLNRQLRIMADGREVWLNPAANYSLDPGVEGEAVESLIDQMPLGEFGRAVGARVVKITVGPEEIELSPGQIVALRRMTRCAFVGGCAP